MLAHDKIFRAPGHHDIDFRRCINFFFASLQHGSKTRDQSTSFPLLNGGRHNG